MMNCPHCNKVLTLNNPVLYNVEAYREPALAVTLCCGQGVTVTPQMSVNILKYTGKRSQDDWGHAIKKAGVGPAPISLLASSVL